MKSNNPFLISGYYSPEYFCDRERETQTITDALYNGRNIILISNSRYINQPAPYGKDGTCQARLP